MAYQRSRSIDYTSSDPSVKTMRMVGREAPIPNTLQMLASLYWARVIATSVCASRL